jgi:hypothetical protein
MERLCRVQPQRITQRHAYIRSLNRHAQQMRAEGRAVTHRIDKQIIAHHGARWRALSAVQQASYEPLAREMREELHTHIRARKLEVASSLELCRTRLLAKDPRNQPVLVSTCVLDSFERQELDDMWDADMFANDNRLLLKEERLSLVQPPPEHYRQVLDAMELGDDKPQLARPDWLSLVCTERDWFSHALFKFGTDDGDLLMKFVYAVQSPLSACFNAAESVDLEALQPTSAYDSLAQPFNSWPYAFRLKWCKYFYTAEGDIKPEWSVHVLPHTVHIGGALVVSNASWLTLAEVREIFPNVGLGGADDVHVDGTRAKDFETTELWRTQPWVWQFLDTGRAPGPDEGDGDGGGHGAHDGRHERDEEVDAEVVYAALEERRLEWAVADPAAYDAFSWRLLGGRWTAEHVGVAFDCFKAEVRPLAKDWCILCGLPRQRQYTIATYGEDASQCMAAAWCHRMQWIYDRRPDEGGAFLPHVVAMDGYIEPPALLALCEHATDRVQSAISDMRRIAPRA